MNNKTLNFIKIYTIIFLIISTIGLLTFTVYNNFTIDLIIYIWGMLDIAYCGTVLKLVKEVKEC